MTKPDRMYVHFRCYKTGMEPIEMWQAQTIYNDHSCWNKTQNQNLLSQNNLAC